MMKLNKEYPKTSPEAAEDIKHAIQEQQELDEVIEETNWISGDYLSAACKMVSIQFIHDHAINWPKTKEELRERCTRMMRQHCPIAYAYFFNNNGNIEDLPMGTIDIILDYIWATPEGKSFLGGKNSGIILPGQ